jgi:hypothetical protein
MIESRKMRWAGHKDARKILVESQKERNHKEDLDVGGRIILKWIVER